MLQISNNKRFLIDEGGRPFFYLGDTAWELFHRLGPSDVEFYLTTRSQQGFNVVQAVALAEHEFDKPNYNGDYPLEDNDPERPGEAYFQNVDFVVSRINAFGMVAGLLPTWGDKWNKKWGTGPELFTPGNAYSFGKFLGARYRHADVIWILGGDRAVETKDQRAILDAMARGLGEGDLGSHLISFHPQGGRSSRDDLDDAPWLNFHMWQTGHGRGVNTASCIARDYNCVPPAPVMDAEPCYEDHPAGFDVSNGYISDYDVRRAVYGGIFAGGFGVTYGCHSVWQFTGAQFAPINNPVRLWQDALHLPAASQMQHLRRLVESRPMLTRIPDDSLLVSAPSRDGLQGHACRDQDCRYAMVYLPVGGDVTVDLQQFAATRMRISWYSPRTGTSQNVRHVAGSRVHSFIAPGYGPDWVLCIDDDAAGFPMPGQPVPGDFIQTA